MKALQAEREARKGAAATLRARDGARSAESHAKDAEGEPQVSAAEDVAEGLRRDDLPCILLLDSAKAHRSQTVFYAIRRVRCAKALDAAPLQLMVLPPLCRFPVFIPLVGKEDRK
jgi:hypothetical protein